MLKRHGFTPSLFLNGFLILSLLLSMGLSGLLPQEVQAAAFQVTSMGFRANEGGGGKLDTKWSTGELGATWAEGEFRLDTRTSSVCRTSRYLLILQRQVTGLLTSFGIFRWGQPNLLTYRVGHEITALLIP